MKNKDRFDILVSLAYDKNDMNFRALVINTPVAPGTLSYWSSADNVLKDLQAIDKMETDNEIKAATNSILSIINDLQVPDPIKMQQAARMAQSQIQTKASNDPKKIKDARYLVVLTDLILSRYYKQGDTTKVEKSEEQGDQEKSKPPPKESYFKFLQRVYKNLKTGKQLDENDTNLWKTYKNIYVNRFNALKSLKNLTQMQTQEKNVLDFVINRIK